jgi:hypothetical protein
MNSCPYGFRIVGTCADRRRRVNHAAAFRAYCSLDERASVDQEAYLSAFTFGEDFRQLLDDTGSPKDFNGPCWAPWLWFDIDASYLQRALDGARRLAAGLVERYRLDDDLLLLFFSGAKGFHIGLPTALWSSTPGADFNRVARIFAEQHGGRLGVTIDSGVYDKVRPFRAPNSRHPRTGLYKRRLCFEELQGLSLEGIRQLAARPEAFDGPTAPAPCDQATRDWQDAVVRVGQRAGGKPQRASNGAATLNRATLDFIRHGADQGDRHRLLFSAAANLAEFNCSSALAHELLTESALDSGLPPADVRRQIECGLARRADAAMVTPPAASATSVAPSPSARSDLQDQLAALWAERVRADTVMADGGDGRADAWEHPLDRRGVVEAAALEFPFGANEAGPYAAEGGRR